MRWHLTTRNERHGNPFSSFEKEIDRVFENFFSLKPTTLVQSEWQPKVDVEENEGIIHVKAEIPGISEKDLDITLSDNILTITGKKEEEKQEKSKGQFTISERFFGSFSRSIPLPSGIKADEIKANTKNGVLNIEIPLEEAKQPKKININ